MRGDLIPCGELVSNWDHVGFDLITLTGSVKGFFNMVDLYFLCVDDHVS